MKVFVFTRSHIHPSQLGYPTWLPFPPRPPPPPFLFSPRPPFLLVSQFLLFHASCHCPSGLKQMSQESPTSLDKQLGSYPRPCEESQQLVPMRASRGLPCSLRSSPDVRDEPQACPGQARMGGVLTESGNRETVSCNHWEHRLWNPADPDVTSVFAG